MNPRLVAPLAAPAALIAAALVLGACAEEPAPSTPSPVVRGQPFLQNGICFVRNRSGRPVRVSQQRCAGLETAN